MSLDDASLVLGAQALATRFANAEAALTAIPTRPITSSFLDVEPVPSPEYLRMNAAGLSTLALVWVLEVSLPHVQENS